MVIPVSGSQQRLLDSGHIDPTWLVDITSASGSLHFSTDRAVNYAGVLYQPYIATVGTFTTTASFPENSTTLKEYQFQIHNRPIQLNGTQYEYVSETFDAFDWELANCNVSVLLTASGELTIAGEDAIPLITSGTVGAPQNVDRFKFQLPVQTRNARLNDDLPLRVITEDDFPEADPDELNGSTYLPIVLGSGVRVRARATGAGATTLVSEQVDSGTTLKVSDTIGWSNGDDFFIGGFTDQSYNITTVDTGSNEFTGITPDLSTFGRAIEIGTTIRENKSTYNYTIADHAINGIDQVFVDGVLISGTQYSLLNTSDANAIGGTRADVRINELITFGDPNATSISQQPEFTVPSGIHAHAVSVSLGSSNIHFAGSTSPGGASAANDGSDLTSFTLDAAGTTTVTYTTHSTLGGVFVEQRYFAVVEDTVSAGEVRLRRGSTNFLIITGAFAKGEFRSSVDTGGSSSSDWNVILNDPPTGTARLYEGWKSVVLNPSVSEDNRNLSETSRDTDVGLNVTGADLEVGKVVEVVCNGPTGSQIDPADPTRLGASAFIARPDYIFRFLLEDVLGQTPEIINLDSYASAGSIWGAAGTLFRLAIERPQKLNTLFDTLAEQSQAIHFWGRGGHTLKFIPRDEDVETPLFFVTEDESGIVDVSWGNSFSALDIRNKITALADRDWVRSTNEDEVYRASVVGQDLESQAKFGLRTNEITGAGSALFFDYIPTSSGAQDVVDYITEQKSRPRKFFELQTDWTYLNLEPGDLIEVQTPTVISSGIKTRIVEHSIDPKLFCRIRAREVGLPPVPPTPPTFEESQVALNLASTSDILADNTDQEIGIANAFTYYATFKWPVGGPGSAVPQLIEIRPTSGGANRFRVRYNDTTESLEVVLFASNGSDFKQYLYPMGDILTTDDEWFELFITWDGTDLKTFYGLQGSSIERTPQTMVSDDALTLTATDRNVEIANTLATLYVTALWDTELSSGARGVIKSNPRHNLNESFGSYAAGGNLQHFWRFGALDDDIGRDWSDAASNAIDLMTNAVGINASDIVVDAP